MHILLKPFCLYWTMQCTLYIQYCDCLVDLKLMAQICIAATGRQELVWNVLGPTTLKKIVHYRVLKKSVSQDSQPFFSQDRIHLGL